MEQPVDYVSTNTMGTVRVLEAARRAWLLRALPFRLRYFQRGMRDE
jgi:dTDP-D-glucose 4,6-dehydratase